MGVRGNGISRHGFRTYDQRQIRLVQFDQVCCLENGFHPRAAYSLYQVGRDLDGNSGIQADMSGKHVGIEAGLRHVAGHYGIDILR